jgi:hypothetical protein
MKWLVSEKTTEIKFLLYITTRSLSSVYNHSASNFPRQAIYGQQ